MQSFTLPHTLPLSCLPLSILVQCPPHRFTSFPIPASFPPSTSTLLVSSDPVFRIESPAVRSHEILGRKRMTEADVHSCDRGNSGIMCGQLLSLPYRLMELHCLAGSHATGRDLILLQQTYRTPCLLEMFSFTQ